MQFIRMAGWLLVAAMAAGSAIAAEKFPQRPVRLIVPYAPGGATDITARLLQQGISELWGQPVIVDNRAGASGNIALALAAKSAPDGDTLQYSVYDGTAPVNIDSDTGQLTWDRPSISDIGT